MLMKHRLILIAVPAIFLLVFSAEAFGCSYPNPPTVEQSFADSDAVLHGVVTYTQGFENQVLAVIEVKKAWKGVKRDKIIVKTGLTSCDIDFKMDQAYYLWLDGEGDRFETVPCRRHAVAEETFLSDKPLLPLEPVVLDPDSKPPPIVESGPPPEPLKREDKSGQFSSFSLVMITSVITTLVVLLIVGVGFYFWQRKK